MNNGMRHWPLHVPTHALSLPRILRCVAAGFVLSLLFSLLPAEGRSQEPSRTFTLVPTDSLTLAVTGRAAGVTWIGPDTLAVLDDIPYTLAEDGHRTVRLVFQDRAGKILLDRDFTGVLDRALAWDGEFLWGCGDNQEGGSLLYKIRLDSLVVDNAYDLSGHRPTGMCFDGRYLWISDRDSGHLDRFDPETEAITRSAPGPAFSPCGLAWDGRQTWLTDRGTGRMYCLTGGRRQWTGTVTAASFLEPGQETLLFHDGYSLFYIPDGGHMAVRAVFR